MSSAIHSSWVGSLVFTIATLVSAPNVICAQERDGASQAGRGTEASVDPKDVEPRRLSGATIAYAVEDRFHDDPLVTLDTVDVQASDDGRVTLTGTVRSLLASDRATRIAETVRGVRGVTNRLQVSPRMKLGPEDLESKIVQALVIDPATESFEVLVQAEPDGSVHLDGEVTSHAERVLTEQVVRGVSGVTAVDNALEVNPSTVRLDAEIRAEVEGLLRHDAYIDDRFVDVEVDDATVRLVGQIGSASEGRRAAALAWTAGTKKVDTTGLRVNPGLLERDRKPANERLSDAAISRAVVNALRADAAVGPDALEVDTRDGTVTLRGTVESLREKRIARNIAREIAGVRAVRERLRVRPTGKPLSDEEIQKRVVSALAASPVTEAYKISVEVDDGIVDLSGHVDSWYDRGGADEVAAGIHGVRAVHNRLEVSARAASPSFEPAVDDWSIHDFDWYDPIPKLVRRDDTEIASAIRDQMWWSPFVDEAEIEVSVDNGVARLTGAVDSWSERRAAVENAFEGGAVSVLNELEIQ